MTFHVKKYCWFLNLNLIEIPMVLKKSFFWHVHQTLNKNLNN